MSALSGRPCSPVSSVFLPRVRADCFFFSPEYSVLLRIRLLQFSSLAAQRAPVGSLDSSTDGKIGLKHRLG